MVKFSGVLWYNKTAELVLKILEREWLYESCRII
jgi:hypothetical protein